MNCARLSSMEGVGVAFASAEIEQTIRKIITEL